MSPEHIDGAGGCDARSDLWSLAVVVFRMLTGALPFAGTDMADLFSRIGSEPALSVRAIVPTLPASLDTFFARALARDPEARFASATAFGQAFAAACFPPKVSVRPALSIQTALWIAAGGLAFGPGGLPFLEPAPRPTPRRSHTFALGTNVYIDLTAAWDDETTFPGSAPAFAADDEAAPTGRSVPAPPSSQTRLR